MFQVWWNKQKLEDYQLYLYGLAALLALVLLWRISTSEQVVLEKKKTPGSEDGDTHQQGSHSPLLGLAGELESQGFSRHPGELLTQWLVRIGHAPLLALVPDHNRLRFDPKGLTEREMTAFSKSVDLELEKLKGHNQEVGNTD